MDDEKDSKWFLKASRERAKKSEEESHIDKLANAMGERRSRDLMDAVANIEHEQSWSIAVEYLIKAGNSTYSTPANFGKQRTKLEPLKFREMIFGLFACNGFEPIEPSTIDILHQFASKRSLQKASVSFAIWARNLAVKQIENGNTLFFFSAADSNGSHSNILNKLEQTSLQNLREISLEQENDSINIKPLWYNEISRRVLSDIGIKGLHAKKTDIDIVLSVLRGYEIDISVNTTSKTELEHSCQNPLNPSFTKLLLDMINQNTQGLRESGSIYSVPTLNILLKNAMSQYQISISSEDYRFIIERITDHIAIRSIDSISTLESIINLDDPRIATPAISALGNYYHESSASAIIDLVCNKRSDWIVPPSMKALENIYENCKEIELVIKAALDSDCINKSTIKNLWRRISK